MGKQNAVLAPVQVKSSRVQSVRLVGRADVFNMEVDEHHNFAIQGGLIVHNCYDAARYFLMTRPIGIKPKPERKQKPYDPLSDDRPRRGGYLAK